jgi:hypothetical protein
VNTSLIREIVGRKRHRKTNYSQEEETQEAEENEYEKIF